MLSCVIAEMIDKCSNFFGDVVTLRIVILLDIAIILGIVLFGEKK